MTKKSGRWGCRIDFCCENCKKIIKLKPSKTNGRRFCSHACASEYQKQGRISICLACNKEYYASPSAKRKYCGIICEKLNRRGRLAWNKGLTKDNLSVKRYAEKLMGRILSEETRKKISESHKGMKKPWAAKLREENFYKKIGLLGAKALYGKKETDIEKRVYEELKNRGLLFEKQYLVNGKFLVDAFIPSLNLIIECDGNYWHNLDRVVKKDKAENAYLTKCGFNLLRLTGTEIKDGTFRERLVS